MPSGLYLKLQTASQTNQIQEPKTMFPGYQNHEEEPKPLHFYIPSLNLGIQGEDQFENPVLVSSLAKPENTSTVEEHGLWGDSNGIQVDGMEYKSQRGMEEESHFTIGEGSGSGHFQLNGIGNVAEPVRHASLGVVATGEGGLFNHHQQQYPCLRVGIANDANNGIQIYENTIDTAAMRRRRRMIKNRESAARSRARKQAYNAQLLVEIKDLSRENEILNTALRALFFEPRKKSESIQRGLLRTFSGPL